MVAHPAQLLVLMLLGMATLAILVTSAFLLYQVARRRTALVVRAGRGESDRTVTATPVSTYRWTRRERGTFLALAALMLLWVFAGKYLVQPFFKGGEPKPFPEFSTGNVTGSSGANLHVARNGSPGAATLVFTHGWGADRQDWDYVIASLKAQHSIVVWDLPGLGQSSSARDYTMQTLARDLDSVVSSIDGPVILVGHSIGGILNIEYARRFPDKMGKQVKALVQVNTTYTNPIETKKDAELSRRLQKPIYEPLLHVVSSAPPVSKALGWLAYSSGLAHLQLASQSFAGNETWQQLDHMASYAYRSSPAVVARGVLGMVNWDGSDALPRIAVPTLIISSPEDTTTLPLASDQMERAIPSAVRTSVDGAAHLGPVERHEQYAQAIEDFASTHARGR